MEPSRQADPPSPIIDSLSVRNPMISIGVVDEHSFTRDCITRSLKEFDDSLDIMSFITCDDCCGA
jgi:hypothetical protein